MKFKKFEWVEFCPELYMRDDFIPVGQVITKRNELGVDKPIFRSRYLYDRPAGFSGPVLSNFYADFDDAEKPQRALMELLDMAEQFVASGCDPVLLKLRFTGGKGGSLEVPYGYFDVEPDEKLPMVWRKVAEHYKGMRHYKTLDMSVYDRRQIWRMTNTRHKSGRFKIPITIAQLKSMKLAAIRELAKNPIPEYPGWDVDDRTIMAEPIVELRALYKTYFKEAGKDHRDWNKKLKKRAPEDFNPIVVFPCVQHLVENGVNADEFQRNPTAFNIAVAFVGLGCDDDDYILDQLVKFGENCDPPFPEIRYPELTHAIDMARKNDYATHCFTPCFEAVCVDKKNCWVYNKEKLPTEAEIVEKEVFSPEIVEFAEKVLNSAEIIDFIDVSVLSDIYQERKTKLALFLLQLNLQSVRMSGVTSSGKSHVTDAVMECFPKHRWLAFTGATDKFLRHMPNRKELWTIYFKEFAAVRVGIGQESTAEYDMKMIMSEGSLRTGIVTKDEHGQLTTVEKEVSVKNFITTSTDVQMAPELRNRQWELSTDPTINLPFVQYRAAQLSVPPWERVDSRNYKAITRCMVETIWNEAPKKWWVPFMTELVPIFEPLQKRTDIRRNIEKLNKFIIASAKLHYRTRPTIEGPDGEVYGVALPEDFYIAWQIGDEAIMGTLTEMTRRMEEVWEAVIEITDANKKLNSASLAAMASCNQENAKKWLNRFTDLTLLQPMRRDSSGIQYRRTVDASQENDHAIPEGISVIITLNTLLELPYYASMVECKSNKKLIAASKKRIKNKNIEVLFPATVRRFSIEDLPDEIAGRGPLSFGTYILPTGGVKFFNILERISKRRFANYYEERMDAGAEWAREQAAESDEWVHTDEVYADSAEAVDKLIHDGEHDTAAYERIYSVLRDNGRHFAEFAADWEKCT